MINILFPHIFLQTVLTRRNTITGIEYRNDPTIFAWELINEPRCMSDASGDTLQVSIMPLSFPLWIFFENVCKQYAWHPKLKLKLGPFHSFGKVEGHAPCSLCSREEI